jgi:hypothetical protein
LKVKGSYLEKTAYPEYINSWDAILRWLGYEILALPL